MDDRQRLDALDDAVREQWRRFDDAVARGLRGAPLAQVNKKLVRLEYERDALADRLRYPDDKEIAP